MQGYTNPKDISKKREQHRGASPRPRGAGNSNKRWRPNPGQIGGVALTDTSLVQHLSSIHTVLDAHSISESIWFGLSLPSEVSSKRSLFSQPVPLCPNPKGRERPDPHTGEIIFVPHGSYNHDGVFEAVRCEKNSCPSCVLTNAQRIAFAIELAVPTHVFCLTLVGDSPDVIRQHVRLFVREVRKEFRGFQCVWAAEQNPGETGVHVHGFGHTLDLDYKFRKGTIRRAVARAGVGSRYTFDPLRTAPSASYCDYLMEDLLDPDLAETFIEMNRTGARTQLINSTRKFWREGPLGVPIRRREAEKISYRTARRAAG